MFKYCLTLFICTLIFFAPFFVISNKRKENFFVASLAIYLQNVNELLENVGTGTDSELSWALKRTIFLPFLDAPFAEQFSAVVAFFGLPQNLKTNPAD